MDIAEDSTSKIVCPRYEVIYEFLRVQDFRPLTNLQQRAFLHLLDLEVEDTYRHGDDCVCMDLLPAIVQALDPDPVNCVVAERTLENETYKSQRFHTEKIGKHQGIVLGMKTKREHTSELSKLARRLFKDFSTVLDELKCRLPTLGYGSDQELIEREIPKTIEFIQSVGRAVKKRSSTNHVREKAVKQLLDQLTERLSKQHAEEKRLAAERHEAQIKKIEQAVSLLGDTGLLEDEIEPPVKERRKKKTTSAAPRHGSTRAKVLGVLVDWCDVGKIVSQTALDAGKIRGVLNASDLRDRIEKRAIGELTEYKLKT